MRTRKLIKYFELIEYNRSRIELGADVRLSPEENLIQLKEGGAGYPTDSDLYAKTWVTNPANARQWLGFEADQINYIVDGVQVTSIGFRLSDGTDEYYWNGASWEVNTTSWNTEEEVAPNISTFPVTDRKLQVVINLKTTDGGYTPKLGLIKVLYSSDIEFQEDIIYRSLVPSLREQIRPISDYPIELVAATDQINLKGDYKLDTPYNILSIDGVFNHTDDPDHWTDLYQSYDSVTQVITLSEEVGVGKVVWVRFIYEPEVAVNTSRDFLEPERVPAIILDDVNYIEAAPLAQDDSVVDKSDGSAVKIPAPIQGNLEIQAFILTDKDRDQHRLADQVKKFFEDNPFLRSRGLDENYRLWLVEEYDMRAEANSADIRTGRCMFRIENVRYWLKDAVEMTAVKRFVLQGDMNVVIEQ